MIIETILEYDFHKSSGKDRHPLLLEIPAKLDFLPAVVSSSRPNKFIVTNSITKDNRIRTGVFQYRDENLDVFLKPLFDCAYDCSVNYGFPNRFKKIDEAMKYIVNSSGMNSQPHIILVPNTFSKETRIDLFGEPDGLKYKNSRLVNCDISHAVLLSRPDFVGMLTRFESGISIVLHNVKLGVAFLS